MLRKKKKGERERKKTQKERVGGSWQGAGLIKNRSFNPVVFQTLASVRITWRAEVWGPQPHSFSSIGPGWEK